jgi:uncharacterized protein (DUF1810 family)
VVADTRGRPAERIFGSVDAMKLRSSMTLFAAAAETESTETDGTAETYSTVFRQVLDEFFSGVADEATVTRL